MEISVENRKIFPPLVFCTPAEWFPWNWVWVPGVKKLESWVYQADKEVWRLSSAVWIECTNVPDRWRGGGQTDGRTYTGPQQRPRLRIASHGKNVAQQTETLENKPKTILT